LNRKLAGSIAAAVVIAGGFFLYKRNAAEIPEIGKGPSTVIKQYGSRKDEEAQTAKVGTSAPPLEKSSEEIIIKHEEKLRKEGYVENPEDPYTMIKKVKKADGKEVIYIMPKDPGGKDYFEPADRTERSAEEVLESKKDVNPADEAASMRRLEEDQNDQLLLGYFRDNSKDIEFKVSSVYEMDDTRAKNDFICFVAPKLGYNMPKFVNTQILSDGTGYGLIKMNDQLYIRITWSFDKERILHGQILSLKNGHLMPAETFRAVQNKESLKYCN